MVILLFLVWINSSLASSELDKCICDCNSKCIYGETCTVTQQCKYYKECEIKEVCSATKNVACKAPKVKVCHIPPGNPGNAHTICIGKSAVATHLGNHGDYLGECRPNCELIEICTAKKCCEDVVECKCNEYDIECTICNCTQADLGAGDGIVEPHLDGGVVDSVIVADQSFIVADTGTQVVDATAADATVADDIEPVIDTVITRPDGEKPINREPDCCVPVDPKTVKVKTTGPTQDFELIGGGCNMGGTSGGLGLLLLASMSLLWMTRKRFTSILLFVVLMGTAGAATATPSMNKDNDDYYNTLNADTLGHFNLNLSMNFEYINRPLKVVTKPGGDLAEVVVDWRQNMNLTSSIGLGSRIQLDLVFPMMLGQSVTTPGFLGLDASVEKLAFYDMKVVPRVNYAKVGALSLGFALPTTLPSGNEASFVGEEGVTTAPTLLIGLRTHNFQLDVNLGFFVRADQSYKFMNQSITVDDEFIYSLGIRVPIIDSTHGLLRRLDLQGDVWGSMSVYEQDKEEVPLEMVGGIQAHLKHGITVAFGAGGGLTKGIGTSRYRIMWSFGWEFNHPKPCRNIVKIRKVPEIVEAPTTEKITILKIERKIVLPPVFFAFDKDVILEQSYPTLQAAADILKEHKWIELVVVSGHTDTRGSDEYNVDLGRRRANNVRKMLIKLGVRPMRVIAVSCGEWISVVKNAKTEKDHARNRRVDFLIPK